MAEKVRSIQREIEKRKEQETQAALPTSVSLTLGALADSAFALSALSNQPLLSAVTNHRIGKLLRLAYQEIEDFQTARKALFVKYGCENKERQQYEITPGNKDAFEHELKELRESPLSLAIPPIKVDALEKAQGLTGVIMMALDWFVVE